MGDSAACDPQAAVGVSAFTGSVLAFGASIALVRWVRSESQVLGLITMLASVVVPFGLWLVASLWLPHRI